MAKIQVADALHKAVDTAIQLLRRARLFQGHAARVDVPLRAPGAAGRRRLRGPQDGAGRAPGARAPTSGHEMSPSTRAAGGPGAPCPLHRRRARSRWRVIVHAKPLHRRAPSRRTGWIELPARARAADGAGFVLRTDAPARSAVSRGRAQEFALLRAAHTRPACCVPEPLWLCRRSRRARRAASLLMRRVAGRGARATRGQGHSAWRRPCRLAERLGAELARIHAMPPPRPDLEFLWTCRSRQPGPGRDRAACAATSIDWERPRPALEWGLRWAGAACARAARHVLIHQDFRTGNYLVDEDGLTGILDWEFAGWGDPDGRHRLVLRAMLALRRGRSGGGRHRAARPISTAATRASGRRIDDAAVHFWEAMETVTETK